MKLSGLNVESVTAAPLAPPAEPTERSLFPVRRGAGPAQARPRRRMNRAERTALSVLCNAHSSLVSANIPIFASFESLEALAWSPTGALAVGEGADILVWTSVAEEPVRRVDAHTGGVHALAWRGSDLVSGGADHAVFCWPNAATAPAAAKPVPLSEGHSSWISAVVVSSDGTRLASASFDGSVVVSGLPDQFLPSFTGGDPRSAKLFVHYAWVRSAAWSPAGDQLATVAQDGIVRVWDAELGRKAAPAEGATAPGVCELGDMGGVARTVAWSPCLPASPQRADQCLAAAGLIAAGGDSGRIMLFDAARGFAAASWHGHTAGVHDLCWLEPASKDHDDADGPAARRTLRLVSAGLDSHAVIWKVSVPAGCSATSAAVAVPSAMMSVGQQTPPARAAGRLRPVKAPTGIHVTALAEIDLKAPILSVSAHLLIDGGAARWQLVFTAREAGCSLWEFADDAPELTPMRVLLHEVHTAWPAPYRVSSQRSPSVAATPTSTATIIAGTDDAEVVAAAAAGHRGAAYAALIARAAFSWGPADWMAAEPHTQMVQEHVAGLLNVLAN